MGVGFSPCNILHVNSVTDNLVSDDGPKPKALLSITAQQETQGNKISLELKDKSSALQVVSNGKVAAPTSCRTNLNTAQQLQLFNRFDTLVC